MTFFSLHASDEVSAFQSCRSASGAGHNLLDHYPTHVFSIPAKDHPDHPAEPFDGSAFLPPTTPTFNFWSSGSAATNQEPSRGSSSLAQDTGVSFLAP